MLDDAKENATKENAAWQAAETEIERIRNLIDELQYESMSESTRAGKKAQYEEDIKAQERIQSREAGKESGIDATEALAIENAQKAYNEALESYNEGVNREAELDKARDSIILYTKQNFPDWLSVAVTGTMPVALNTNDYLIVDLFSGFGLAFIFISIIMGLLFLSVRIGLISMLPNLIPIVFAAGYLGFMGIPIRPPIAITFSICLGIAVDDSLHFLFRFWQEKKKNSNMEIAISNTIETTGLAMLTSTIVLVSGFMVITVSNFIPTSQFGIISAITLTVAFITDVTLLPALLYIFPFKRLKIKND